MAYDFPSGPATGGRFKPGPEYAYNGAQWDRYEHKALFRNRLVNGGMLVSQQNGDTGLTAAGGSHYPADQWLVNWNIPGSSITVARQTSGSGAAPFGAVKHLSTLAATGKATLAANEYLQIIHTIEGNRVADFLWGTAQARPAVLRFDVHTGNTFGQYTIKICNFDETRNFLAAFSTTVAGAWQSFVVPVPGCTDGTWKTDTSTGIQIRWFPASALPIGVPGWQGGSSVYTLPGQSNCFSVTGQDFRLANVGFYLDPWGTGVAPFWVTPQFADDLRDSQRYWWRMNSLSGICAGAASINRGAMQYPVQMRVAPAATIVGTVPTHCGNAGGTLTGLGTIYATNEYFESELQTTGMTAGNAGLTYISGDGSVNYIAVNARM